MIRISSILDLKIDKVYKLKENYYDSFEETNTNENEIIYSLLQSMVTNKNEYKILFRGENKNKLKTKLFSKLEDYREEKLFERLFYFGDKAKSYFKVRDPQKYLKSIDDISKETFEYVFNQLSDIFNKYISSVTLLDFKSENETFYDYFLNKKNCDLFTNKILLETDEIKLLLRDYYLYLLHTSEFWKLKERTYFVSTSEKKEIALSFATNFSAHNTGFIFIYFIKYPFKHSGINLEIMNQIIPNINRMDLPNFSSNLYPGEYEFAVKGGLFPHHIIAVYDISNHKLVVNPYIFLYNQSVESILQNGSIKIDQSKFYTKLLDTGYKGYITYFVKKKIFTDRFVNV